MNFFNFLLTAGEPPKKFMLFYKHLQIINYSPDTLTLYFSNGSEFAKIYPLDAITFLDLVQQNLIKVGGRAVPSMQLTIESSGVNSLVSVYNYGV